MRKFHRDRQNTRTRLLVLIAALVITMVWAQSEMKPRLGSRHGGRANASGGIGVAAPAEATVVADEATPEGWGADPFDPRSLGSTPATTGR